MPKGKPKRYASILYSMAEDRGVVREVYQSLQLLSSLYKGSPSFRLFFYTTKTTAEEKMEVISSLLGDDVQGIALQFLALLADKKEHRLLQSTTAAFESLYRSRMNLVAATTTTSFPLGNDEYKQIRKRLEESLGKEIEMTRQVDPQLIGGVKFRIGNIFLDGSVASQLERMRRSLLQ